MKNTRITFRLSAYQLARGLQVVRQLEPTYKLTSINELVKTIYHDYVAKMTYNKLDAVPQEFVDEILLLGVASAKQVSLDSLMEIRNKTKPKKSKEIIAPKEIKQKVSPILSTEILEEINKIESLGKASQFNDPNETESSISAVTDFSPPKDWMDEE